MPWLKQQRLYFDIYSSKDEKNILRMNCMIWQCFWQSTTMSERAHLQHISKVPHVVIVVRNTLTPSQHNLKSHVAFYALCARCFVALTHVYKCMRNIWHIIQNAEEHRKTSPQLCPFRTASLLQVWKHFCINMTELSTIQIHVVYISMMYICSHHIHKWKSKWV